MKVTKEQILKKFGNVLPAPLVYDITNDKVTRYDHYDGRQQLYHTDIDRIKELESGKYGYDLKVIAVVRDEGLWDNYVFVSEYDISGEDNSIFRDDEGTTNIFAEVHGFFTELGSVGLAELRQGLVHKVY